MILAITALWAAGVLVPMVTLLLISLFKSRGIAINWTLSLDSYVAILTGFRLDVILRTLRITLTVTLIELLVAFPFALWLAKGLRAGTTKTVTLVLLVVPFFLSAAARTIVWRSILGRTGLINISLMSSGLIDHPLDWLLFSEFSVHLGLIGPYFPSMVWPLFISMSLIDDELISASRDLGGSERDTLRNIIVPLALPGVVAGIIFTAVPLLGDNVVATLLGGGRVSLLADGVNDLVDVMNFTGAAAMASMVLLVMLAMTAIGFLAIRRAGGGRIFESLRA